uniref:Transcription initiation factor TFIID subunit 8 n=1 Tax=Rhizophora mucronata TaxID=61149 RepID=A0A2P2MXU6_RHIMU
MSNGAAKNATGRPKVDEFGLAVSRIAVAQICESVGFHGFKESALDSLTDIAIRYLCDLGKTASFYANLSGRTQCNLFDVVRGFEDFGMSHGFSGASSSVDCLIDSGTVKEVIQYVGSSEEIHFVQAVPRFPVVRDGKLIPSFMNMGETPPGKHIPPWLPALPDPHTYLSTPMWNERVSDPRAENIEQARQRRKAERALLSLQQRLLTNGSADASSSLAKNDEVKGLGLVESNPFLATPLNPGEKDISTVALPDKLKDYVSVTEAFAPAIDAVNEGGLNGDGDSDMKFLPEKRPAVNFKFKNRKKLLGESFDLSLSRKSTVRTGHWLGRNEERDDKKRRAEYILRQSMENPQELILL